MNICNFCGEEYIELCNHSEEGFWCEICNGFTYFDNPDPHKFLMILENGKENAVSATKSKLNKRLSPLRYPGGKSKLIDFLILKFSAERLNTFVEPYAGGASVGLSLLEHGLIDHLVLNDLDFGIYGLYKTILENPEYYYKKLDDAPPTHEDFFRFRQSVLSGYEGLDEKEAGWQMLVVNRLAYSGILKANPLGGKNGSVHSLLSRYNPKDLKRRMSFIHSKKEKIEVLNDNALEVIEEYYWSDSTTLFIDPPYYEKGADLYNKSYISKDHYMLAKLLDSLFMGYPGADMILTYDDHKFIEELYKYPRIEKIGRIFSV